MRRLASRVLATATCLVAVLAGAAPAASADAPCRNDDGCVRVLRVSGLVSVSAPTLDELEAATAAIEQSAIQASCETRRLVGQQAVAFTAAALPLCRIV